MFKILSAVAALIAAFTATLAEARWLRAETDSFIIYSEGNEKSLREFAETLQRFDSALRFLVGIGVEGEENRLPIYLLASAQDVSRLATGSRQGSIAGFYVAGSDGSFALANRQRDTGYAGTSAAQQILFHEYSHHFMKRYVRAAFPAWFIEGFAEYYSTVEFNKEGKAEIGRPVYRRAYGLLQMPKVPAEKLLFERPSAMRNSGQMDVYYGRAWILTHMLYHNPARAGQLGTYMKDINAGTDPRQAAIDAFGDLAQLDRDLDRYIRAPLGYRTLRDATPVPTNITIAALPAVEDALMPLRLERMSARGNAERIAKVRDDLRRLAALHGDNAEVQYELAAAEWAMDRDTRDPAAVRAALDRALAAKADHVRANVMLGRLLLRDLHDKGADDEAAWREARRPIQLANRTDPNDPIPLYAYFRSFQPEGRRPPDIAIKALERAFALAPENIELRVANAFALANQGDFDTALKLAQTVAFDPHDTGQGERLLEQLENMRKIREGGSTAEIEIEIEDDDND
ncbi:MAG TPA: tetratricopeptide repeat protein [Sphingopyxis sp.]|nr:tetratricopeptide repeat protein [Sphingopyxis sp.]HMP43800.1 tetratricopeptide repeat protein [Sphingopyxis sp.]HMQ19034.1 tetratricopeptide repeat protein [Sphingopyxis sp.]